VGRHRASQFPRTGDFLDAVGHEGPSRVLVPVAEHHIVNVTGRARSVQARGVVDVPFLGIGITATEDGDRPKSPLLSFCELCEQNMGGPTLQRERTRAMPSDADKDRPDIVIRELRRALRTNRLLAAASMAVSVALVFLATGQEPPKLTRMQASELEIVNPETNKVIAAIRPDRLSEGARLELVGADGKMLIVLKAERRTDRRGVTGRIDLFDSVDPDGCVSVKAGTSGNIVRFLQNGAVDAKWP
jgi:hypothetical protein